MKIICILLLLNLCCLLFGQISFYGDFSSSVTGAIDGGNHYDTPLNRGNAAGLNDLALTNALTIKLAGSDELANLELWFSLDQYPIGAGLMAAAYDNPVAAGYVDEVVASAGDSIYSFNLQRAAISWYMGDNLLARLGRQSMQSGYGYGWNPMDFANPLKNPSNPQENLKGVDALQFHFFPDSPINLKIYGLYDQKSRESGADYNDLMGGGELTMYLGFTEIKLSGLYDYDRVKGEDERTSALGIGFLADPGGLGLYGEGSLLFGGRTSVADGSGSLSRKDSFLNQALVGLEYTFPFELTLIGEYFYNGEGFNEAERNNYETDLIAIGPSSAYLVLFRPGYFSQHYMLLNLSYPFYEMNLNGNASILYSIDGGALSFSPSIDWYGSGNLTISLKYSRFYNLRTDQVNEASLSPVKQAVTLKGTYSF